jgi:hypothetical protein
MLFCNVAFPFTLPRTDIIECGLAEGGKFIIRDTYRWDPIAEHLPAVVTTIYDRGNYEVWYVNPQGVIDKNVPSDIKRSEDCSLFGSVKGIPIITGSFKQKNSDWFSAKNLPDNLILTTVASRQPALVRNQLYEKALTPATDRAFLLPIKHRLVYEIPLLGDTIKFKPKVDDQSTKNMDTISLMRLGSDPAEYNDEQKIMAVYQSFSSDQGGIWSDPEITYQAEIFELGKSLSEQSFVGKTERYNGKSILHIKREHALKLAEEARRKEAYKKVERAQKQQLDESLQGAIELNDFPRFEKLLQSGVDIDQPLYQFSPPPLRAALEKPDYARYALALIQRGANLNPKGLKPDATLLMIAAGNSTPEVLKALIDKQAIDINRLNPNGETALTYAVAAGRQENVKLLLQRGAIQVRNKEGKLVDLDSAQRQGFPDIVYLLEQHK